MITKSSSELKRQLIEAVDPDVLFDNDNEEKRAEELTKLLLIAGINTTNAITMEKARKVIESFTVDDATPPKKHRMKKNMTMLHIDEEHSIK